MNKKIVINQWIQGDVTPLCPFKNRKGAPNGLIQKEEKVFHGSY